MRISPIRSNIKLSFFIVKCILKCNESEHNINSCIIYLAKIIYLKSHGLHIFVKFTKNKMGYASGFRAINGLPRALWDKTGSASLTNIPFPLCSHSIHRSRNIVKDRWTQSHLLWIKPWLMKRSLAETDKNKLNNLCSGEKSRGQLFPNNWPQGYPNYKKELNNWILKFK